MNSLISGVTSDGATKAIRVDDEGRIVLIAELVSVLTYGAVGDGVADDTAAFAAAFAVNPKVYVPTGTYKITAALVPALDGGGMYGDGESSEIITSSTTISGLELNGVENFTLKGIKLTGGGANNAAPSSGKNGVYITGSSRVVIEDCYITKWNVGVYATGSAQDVTVRQCSLIANARAGVNAVTASRVFVTNCFTDGTRTGVGDEALSLVGYWFQAGSTYFQIVGCRAENHANEGINLKGQYYTVNGCIVTTTDNGIICETDSADSGASDNGSFGTISGCTVVGVTSTAYFAGNTIGINDSCVHDVVFSGNLAKGCGNGFVAAGLGTSGSDQRPNRITFSGNVVAGTTTGTGFSINADDSVVDGNTVYDSQTDGMQVYYGKRNRITNNVIAAPDRNGIYLFSSADDNTVAGNSVSNGGTDTANTYDAIRIDASDTIVANNTVQGTSFRYGINDESGASNTKLLGNRILSTYGTAALNLANSTVCRMNLDSTTLNVRDDANRIGHNTSTPGTTFGGTSAGLDFVGQAMKVGGSSATARADDATKTFVLMVVPYDTTPAVEVIGLYYTSGSSRHDWNYGGGSASGYACNRHVFYTAANQTTTTGTEVLRIDENQNVGVRTGANATSMLEVGGSFGTKYTASATSLSLSGAHQTVAVTATGQTITLPTAVGITGREYCIKLTASGSGTVATTSAQTIDGAGSYSLSAQYKFVTVKSDGANWLIVAAN